MNDHPESTKHHRPVIGWREWVQLTDLHVKWIKAKVDSGARSSSIHADQVESFSRDGKEWIRFVLYPHQKNDKSAREVEAEVLEWRHIRSSNGKTTLRPVIVTPIKIKGNVFPVELTLADRNQMGFRMLLGREAFRGRFLVDAGRSYLGGKPKIKKKNKSEEPGVNQAGE